MKAFLLAEQLEYPYGDGALVIAENEDRARKLASSVLSRLFASNGQSLWQSDQTACVVLGDCPADTPEEVLMKGSIMHACLVEHGVLHHLRLASSERMLSTAV